MNPYHEIRHRWLHTPSCFTKFQMLSHSVVREMLTREEIEGFLLECQNKDCLHHFLSCVLDVRQTSTWRSLFLDYLFDKNPDIYCSLFPL